ncbi:MAG: hypothetical protein KAX49_13835 [Halanaerobiales bacterium]|nr:hypothetical protein [Halanaerobiales bacterium]
MDCPLMYQEVITRGNLVLKYFSKAMHCSCCWYALKKRNDGYEVLTAADKQEIIAIYKDGQLMYLNKELLKTPLIVR